MICTPASTARHAHASDAGKRSSTSAPSNFPMNDLRETPKQQRTRHLCKTPQVREQLQIMLQRLAKTDADIQHHLVGSHAGGVQSLQPFLKKFTDLANDIRVNRIFLHRLRRAPRVHANITRAGIPPQPRHIASSSRLAATSLTMLAPAASAARATAGFIVSMEIGILHATGQLFDDRQDAAQFLRFADRLGAGPRGFAADVENFRALRDQFQRVRHGGAGVQKFSAIGKGIGRDIDDAHDERRARKNEFKLAGAENHLPAIVICRSRGNDDSNLQHV